MTVRNAKQVKELKQRIMIMRKIFFLLLTLLGQICLAQGVVVPKSGAALDKETGSSFCPLDSIPDWVKEKTTQKEYELWKKAHELQDGAMGGHREKNLLYWVLVWCLYAKEEQEV